MCTAVYARDVYHCTRPHTHRPTHSLARSLTHARKHARTHPPTHSLSQPASQSATNPPPHPLTHPLTHLTSPHLTSLPFPSLPLTSPHTHLILTSYSPHTHLILTSHSHSHSHSLTLTHSHSLTHSLSLTLSLSLSLARSLAHSLTHSHTCLLPLNMGMLGYVNFTGCTEINGLSDVYYHWTWECLAMSILQGVPRSMGCLQHWRDVELLNWRGVYLQNQSRMLHKERNRNGMVGMARLPGSQLPKKRVTQLTWMACLVVSGFTQWTPRVAVWPSWSTLSCKSSHSWPVALLGVNQARVIKRTPSYKKVCCNMIWMKDRWCKASTRCKLIKTWELIASQHDPTLGPHISRLRPWRHITPATKPALDGPPKFNIQWPEVGHLQHQTNHTSLVGPRPLDGRCVLLGWGGVGHVLTLMWTCTWSRCYTLAVDCGMY